MKRRVAIVVLAAALTACGTSVKGGPPAGIVFARNARDHAVTVGDDAIRWGRKHPSTRTFWVCPRAFSRLRIGEFFDANNYFDHQKLYCR